MGEKKRRRKERTIQYFDYSLLAVMIFLVCFGLVMLYSGSSYESLTKFDDGMYYFKRQAAISLGSGIAMLIIAQIDYHLYAKPSIILYWAAMFMMALVRFTPLGIEAYGTKRWLRLPANQQLQPSEVMKVAVILFIPYLLCKMGDKINTGKGFKTIFWWGFIAAGGVFYLTDNLSTAIIVFGICFGLVFVVHKKTKPFVYMSAGAVTIVVAAAVICGKLLENSTNFRIRRILAWLYPEKFADSGAFQTMQGFYAIGSGGFFGKGLGNGAQKMIIPEVQNDMILTVICEELGVFGAIMVLTLFGLLLYRLLVIAQNAPDLYGSLIVTGIFIHIGLQVILNVAVVLNVIPTTGITLPFISYGGTSILFLMSEIGIALGVSKKIRLEE